MKIIGVFCDDIRPEIAGTESIIGVFPDNLVVNKIPAVIPKLGIYLRIQISSDEEAKECITTMKTPWDDKIALGKADANLIQGALDEARKKKLPIAGVVMRAMLAPFSIYGSGQLTIVATIDGQEQICAVLNIQQQDDGQTATSSTASQPPASRSLPAAPQS